MKISLIVAHDKNGLIGINGKIPWNIPEDLAHFKKLTMGNPIIMGRKTFESLGNKPLLGRKNVVLSRSFPNGFYYDVVNGIYKSTSLEIALSVFSSITKIPEIFIIGGESVYTYALPFVDTIYRTIVDGDFDGAGDKSYFQESARLGELGFQNVDLMYYDSYCLFTKYERINK